MPPATNVAMPHLFHEDSWPGGASQRYEHRVELVIERGDAEQLIRRIEVPVFLIGASPDCDLVLGDRQFADYHACIRCSRAWVAIRNLAGSPEITVNRRITRWAELQHDDRLRMGPYQFRVRLWPTPGEPSTRAAHAHCQGHCFLDPSSADLPAGISRRKTQWLGDRSEFGRKWTGVNRIATRS